MLKIAEKKLTGMLRFEQAKMEYHPNFIPDVN